LNPRTWATKRFRLFFVCPVTKKVVGGVENKGYLIKMPKDWVVKYGPAIKVGLQAISLAITAGVVFGFPLGPVGTAVGSVLKAEEAAVARLESALGDNLAEVAYDAAIEAAAAAAETFFDALDASEPDTIVEQHASAQQARQVTGAAYRALRALVEEKDPNLLNCGLVKETSREGTVEWVHPEGRARFKELGRAAFFWAERSGHSPSALS